LNLLPLSLSREREGARRVSVGKGEGGAALSPHRPLALAAALQERHGALFQQAHDPVELGPIGLGERGQQLLLDGEGEGGDLLADRRPLGRQLQDRAAAVVGVGDNPMGTDGFEFVEYASARSGELGALFETMGFVRWRATDPRM
jgi:hypothetical protein